MTPKGVSFLLATLAILCWAALSAQLMIAHQTDFMVVGQVLLMSTFAILHPLMTWMSKTPTCAKCGCARRAKWATFCLGCGAATKSLAARA